MEIPFWGIHEGTSGHWLHVYNTSDMIINERKTAKGSAPEVDRHCQNRRGLVAKTTNIENIFSR
jgi:hypothetical protein